MENDILNDRKHLRKGEKLLPVFTTILKHEFLTNFRRHLKKKNFLKKVFLPTDIKKFRGVTGNKTFFFLRLINIPDFGKASLPDYGKFYNSVEDGF